MHRTIKLIDFFIGLKTDLKSRFLGGNIFIFFVGVMLKVFEKEDDRNKKGCKLNRLAWRGKYKKNAYYFYQLMYNSGKNQGS